MCRIRLLLVFIVVSKCEKMPMRGEKEKGKEEAQKVKQMFWVNSTKRRERPKRRMLSDIDYTTIHLSSITCSASKDILKRFGSLRNL